MSEYDELKWEVLKVEHLVQDEWIDFRRVRYRLPDGSEFEPYYNYSRRSFVIIAARDEEGNYINKFESFYREKLFYFKNFRNSFR